MGAAPVVYGQASRAPRGDYTRAAADYTCAQNHAAYTAAEHALYRRLYRRQSALLPDLAGSAFIAALPQLGAGECIPHFDAINARLYRATRWQIVAVPGLIPELPFFRLLAQRRFPVTDWLRRPEEQDYIVEPDIFHDLFGHVPLLFDPVFADYVQRYGQGGIKAHALGACELLSRLYWYTIEFGLIRERAGLRAYGAGILSSAAELQHALRSPQPLRLALDLERCMRTRYRIDSYQQSYFVIDSFEQLFQSTAADFAPLYQRLRGLPEFAPDGSVDGGGGQGA